MNMIYNIRLLYIIVWSTVNGGTAQVSGGDSIELILPGVDVETETSDLSFIIQTLPLYGVLRDDNYDISDLADQSLAKNKRKTLNIV